MGMGIGTYSESTTLFEAACHPDPVFRLAGVNRALEGLAIDVFTTMRNFAIEMNDPVLEFCEDWMLADEVTHVKMGSNWLRELTKDDKDRQTRALEFQRTVDSLERNLELQRTEREPLAETPGWAPEWRTRTLGLVLTITLVGFESLAITTAMPVAAADLGGLRLFGWVFSAFFLGQIIGTVTAGRSADRVGPARGFVTALACFALGLAVAGAAPTMEVIVAAGIERNLSLKLTPLGVDVDRATCVDNLRRILDPGARHGFFVRIDMENSPYTERTLEIFETLWGIGYRNAGVVIQSCLKRSEADIRRVNTLGARVRLVKGAYWDGEIKRAQLDGLAGFPVFTRKIHTDVSYVACARKLLGATEHGFAAGQKYPAGPPSGALRGARTRAAPGHNGVISNEKSKSQGQPDAGTRQHSAGPREPHGHDSAEERHQKRR